MPCSVGAVRGLPRLEALAFGLLTDRTGLLLRTKRVKRGRQVRSRLSSWWRFEAQTEAPRVRWGSVESGLRSSTARGRDRRHCGLCCAAAAPLSSPAPSAHRCAAAGLDSGTPAERWASMPFDGAVDRARLA